MRTDRLSRLSPLIVAVFAGLACDSPVGLGGRGRQRGEQPATLDVYVLFADSASGVAYPFGPPVAGAAATGPGARVAAHLRSGVDGEGDARRIVSDTLGLLDTTLTATRTARSGVSGGAPQPPTPTYAAFIRMAERDFAARPVAVTRAPTIQGVTGLATPAAAYAVGRAGFDTITVNPGSDLVLRLVLPPDSTSRPGPTGAAQWSVLLQGDAGAQVTVTGPGLPPAVVRIAAELLPVSARGEIVARLFAQRHASAGGIQSLQFDPRAFLVSLHVESRLAWRVRLAR